MAMILDYLRKTDPETYNTIASFGNSKGLTKQQLEDVLASGKADETFKDIGAGAGWDAKIKKALGDNNQNLIESTKNEADLTDEELQGRLEAFQGKEGNRPAFLNEQKLLSDIQRAVRESYPTLAGAQATEDDVTNISQKVYREALNPGSGGWIGTKELEKWKVLPEQFRAAIQNYWEKPASVGEDISRIQEDLMTRKSSQEQDSEIEKYISGMPAELQAGRDEFMKGEEDRAFNELERQVPLVLQNLNARGMLFSGEQEDALTSRAMNLESSLEQIQSDLEAEDNQFYYDAAYRNALRTELKNTQDYKSAIEEKRRTVLTDRERNYKSTQSDLSRQLDEDLKRSEYTRDLALRRKQLQNERDAQDQAQKGQLVSGIASAGTGLLVGGLSRLG